MVGPDQGAPRLAPRRARRRHHGRPARTLRASVAAITANGFGVCHGPAQRAGVNHLPLTDWMEQTLRDLDGPLGTTGRCASKTCGDKRPPSNTARRWGRERVRPRR